ncbi:MAG TPA: MoaD/ThiS family protein [Candidatus Binataceae bacterium]|nr:MoaD/ThiS family protein [Candidatus Binataceae bacterium]
MPTAIIPALLRKFTAGRERVSVRGGTVREVVADLERQFPGLALHLLQADDIKPSIAVSIDGEIVPGGVLEPVAENSEVHFLPALGGGA